MLKKIKDDIRSHFSLYSYEQAISVYPLLVLAAILYFQHAWVEGMFLDGNLYAAFGKHAVEKGHWILPHLSTTTYPVFTQHLPLTFILEGMFFKVFGASFLTARIFGALFSFMTVCLIYKYVKEFSCKRWAYISTLFFIIIPPLIKKTRFPNMDVVILLFMFISLNYFFRAYKQSNIKNWSICGLFFGLAMLTKGPIAVFLPITFVLYILLNKKIEILKDYRPWLGLICGLLLFSLWPLFHYLDGNLAALKAYWGQTFEYTIRDGRGVEHNNIFAYVLFLLKQVGPIFLLSIFIMYKTLKNYKEKNEYLFLHIIFFVTTFVLLSISTFKYSHYLIPLYPSLAIIAGHFIKTKSDDFFRKVSFSVKCIVPVLALVLLIFPITTETKRDKELFIAKDIISKLESRPNAWGIVDNVYPFFSAANLLGFTDSAEVFQLDSHLFTEIAKGNKVIQNIETKAKVYEDFVLNDYKWVFLVHENAVNKIEINYSEFNKKFTKYLYFKKRRMFLVIPNQLLPKKALLEVRSE